MQRGLGSRNDRWNLRCGLGRYERRKLADAGIVINLALLDALASPLPARILGRILFLVFSLLLLLFPLFILVIFLAPSRHRRRDG